VSGFHPKRTLPAELRLGAPHGAHGICDFDGQPIIKPFWALLPPLQKLFAPLDVRVRRMLNDIVGTVHLNPHIASEAAEYILPVRHDEITAAVLWRLSIRTG
jgi:hypothetical protein